MSCRDSRLWQSQAAVNPDDATQRVFALYWSWRRASLNALNHWAVSGRKLRSIVWRSTCSIAPPSSRFREDVRAWDCSNHKDNLVGRRPALQNTCRVWKTLSAFRMHAFAGTVDAQVSDSGMSLGQNHTPFLNVDHVPHSPLGIWRPSLFSSFSTKGPSKS